MRQIQPHIDDMQAVSSLDLTPKQRFSGQKPTENRLKTAIFYQI
jgi:hypothetical protein